MSSNRNWVSLRVHWNPKTGAMRMPAYVEISGDRFVRNPAEEALREFGLAIIKDADPQTSLAVRPITH
jgi:hypothetical protein